MANANMEGMPPFSVLMDVKGDKYTVIKWEFNSSPFDNDDITYTFTCIKQISPQEADFKRLKFERDMLLADVKRLGERIETRDTTISDLRDRLFNVREALDGEE